MTCIGPRLAAFALGYLFRCPRAVGEVIGDMQHGDRVQNLELGCTEEQVHKPCCIRLRAAGYFTGDLRCISH
jgi:hypothetical protein